MSWVGERSIDDYSNYRECPLICSVPLFDILMLVYHDTILVYEVAIEDCLVFYMVVLVLTRLPIVQALTSLY